MVEIPAQSADGQTIVLATGGTGGHIFPAEALAEVLLEAGHQPVVITDRRFTRYAQNEESILRRLPHYTIPASPLRRGAVATLRGAIANVRAVLKARRLLRLIGPDAVVGFGGYPCFPTVFAACNRYPTLLHEQNAILGKTNRLLAPRVDAIAGSFDGDPLQGRGTPQAFYRLGNPVRTSIQALREIPYPHLEPDGMMQVLITGGSQGAEIFGQVVPEAVALLPPAQRRRLRIDQQVRPEQLAALRERYATIDVHAELMPFFTDLPARLACAHLVIARAGASTIAELTCAGRPAILVPLPHATDDHQRMNARMLDDAGGAWLIPQEGFTPEALAARLESFLNVTDSLKQAARQAHQLGRPQATQELAALVLSYARANRSASPSTAASARTAAPTLHEPQP